MATDIVSFLARWALLHELADDAWKAAVARGRAGSYAAASTTAPHYAVAPDGVAATPSGATAATAGRPEAGGGQAEGRDAFVDGLAALIADEKDALREILARGEAAAERDESGSGAVLEEMRFELAEMRGRLEGLEAAVDALVRRLTADTEAGL